MSASQRFISSTVRVPGANLFTSARSPGRGGASPSISSESNSGNDTWAMIDKLANPFTPDPDYDPDETPSWWLDTDFSGTLYSPLSLPRSGSSGSSSFPMDSDPCIRFSFPPTPTNILQRSPGSPAGFQSFHFRNWLSQLPTPPRTDRLLLPPPMSPSPAQRPLRIVRITVKRLPLPPPPMFQTLQPPLRIATITNQRPRILLDQNVEKWLDQVPTTPGSALPVQCPQPDLHRPIQDWLDQLPDWPNDFKSHATHRVNPESMHELVLAPSIDGSIEIPGSFEDEDESSILSRTGLLENLLAPATITFGVSLFLWEACNDSTPPRGASWVSARPSRPSQRAKIESYRRMATAQFAGLELGRLRVVPEEPLVCRREGNEREGAQNGMPDIILSYSSQRGAWVRVLA
ncbi:hypothetical protein B7494_g4930 [Chlorociboria aeruginascens]|nr:hypothetical protein B7494_g4930 [Chlorociboria aeruginascens]